LQKILENDSNDSRLKSKPRNRITPEASRCFKTSCLSRLARSLLPLAVMWWIASLGIEANRTNFHAGIVNQISNRYSSGYRPRQCRIKALQTGVFTALAQALTQALHQPSALTCLPGKIAHAPHPSSLPALYN
jgi:hypothetical protein